MKTNRTATSSQRRSPLRPPSVRGPTCAPRAAWPLQLSPSPRPRRGRRPPAAGLRRVCWVCCNPASPRHASRRCLRPRSIAAGASTWCAASRGAAPCPLATRQRAPVCFFHASVLVWLFVWVQNEVVVPAAGHAPPPHRRRSIIRNRPYTAAHSLAARLWSGTRGKGWAARVPARPSTARGAPAGV